MPPAAFNCDITDNREFPTLRNVNDLDFWICKRISGLVVLYFPAITFAALSRISRGSLKNEHELLNWCMTCLNPRDFGHILLYHNFADNEFFKVVWYAHETNLQKY